MINNRGFDLEPSAFSDKGHPLCALAGLRTRPYPEDKQQSQTEGPEDPLYKQQVYNYIINYQNI